MGGVGGDAINASIRNGGVGGLQCSSDAATCVREVNELQAALKSKTRLGIPVSVFAETTHSGGFVGSTVFPMPITTGGSWNTSLMEEIGAAIALELRSAGGDQGLGPILQVCTGAVKPWPVPRVPASPAVGHLGLNPSLNFLRVSPRSAFWENGGKFWGGSIPRRQDGGRLDCGSAGERVWRSKCHTRQRQDQCASKAFRCVRRGRARRVRLTWPCSSLGRAGAYGRL